MSMRNAEVLAPLTYTSAFADERAMVGGQRP
jgi:hypothetical protein